MIWKKNYIFEIRVLFVIEKRWCRNSINDCIEFYMKKILYIIGF